MGSFVMCSLGAAQLGKDSYCCASQVFYKNKDSRGGFAKTSL